MGNRPLVHEGDNLKKTVTYITLGLGKILETLSLMALRSIPKSTVTYIVLGLGNSFSCDGLLFYECDSLGQDGELKVVGDQAVKKQISF